MTVTAAAYRRAQRRVSLDTMSQVADQWALLDMNDLDGTFPRWVAATSTTVRAQRALSSQLAGVYYTSVRAAKVLDPVSFAPVSGAPADPSILSSILLNAGPVKVKQALSAGLGLDRAATLGLTGSATAAARIALDGGRSAMLASTRADPQARGWARVGGGQCAFCAMLIARGPVYSQDTADFPSHRGCQCVAVPVFGDDYDGQAHAEDLRSQLDAGTFIASDNGPAAAIVEAQTPRPLTARVIAEKARSQAEWARSQGFNVTVHGRTVTGVKPNVSITWKLAGNGAWVIDRA